jgi:L1 cell adhesion molecule like protein
MTDDYIIGIDLGTTNSCVGVWKNERVEIISNILGKRVTPSYVCYKSNSKILVGEQAKDQIIKNIKNTIYDTKRLIGRNFSYEIVQNDIKLWSFSVKGDVKDKPIIEVTINKEKKIFYPEQVAAQILGALKKDAEDYLGKEVKNAVITVPAYFNNSQRQSTIDAGRIAGLNVIRTINEPTAAAIAYGLENKSDEKRKILIFDFGGGTFDITIIDIKNNEFDVITSQGDSHLGGEDIDTKISEYCLENFKKKTGIEISSKNQKALKRLKSQCIEAKHLLSMA